jgi:hypothetical protein
MLVIFFDCEGIVHQKFVPPGQMVYRHYFREVLQYLREQVYQKCLEQWQRKNWFIHCDNTLVHTALSVQQFLSPKNMAVVPNTPYSSDLAPCFQE